MYACKYVRDISSLSPLVGEVADVDWYLPPSLSYMCGVRHNSRLDLFIIPRDHVRDGLDGVSMESVRT